MFAPQSTDRRKSLLFWQGLYGGGGGGGKAATKPVGPGFDGSEPATRWKGIK